MPTHNLGKMIIPTNCTQIENIKKKNQNSKEDICKTLQNLNIQEDEKEESFLNLNCKSKDAEDTVCKLSEKFSDINIHENKKKYVCLKVNWSKQGNNEIFESNDLGGKEESSQNDCKPNLDKEKGKDTLKENYNNATDIRSKAEETKDVHEEKEEKEKQNEAEEINEVKKSDVLCARAPMRNHVYRSHENAPLYSRSHQSGGTVVVAESSILRGQPVKIPIAPLNNSCYNITVEEQTQNFCSIDNQEHWEVEDLLKIAAIADDPIFQKVFETAVQGSDDLDKTKNIPLTTCNVDIPVPGDLNTGSSCSSSGVTCISKMSSNTEVAEMSPRSYDQSPLGSPNLGFSYSQPSPSAASSSGVSSSKESPQHNMSEILNDNSIESYTDIWFRNMHKYTPINRDSRERPICPKPPPSKIEPNAARSKLVQKLNESIKLRAWARAQSYSEDFFLTGDEEDGDTQLMIVVGNKCEGQLEYIYAMVERMRDIPFSLSKRNRAGHSALYIACCEMVHEPLVPAYIAEALLEQNIDVTKETYNNNLTIPEILKKKGVSHKDILKELLALKKSNGKLVFQSYVSDINGNIGSPVD